MIHVITGAPCSGKSTYIDEHAKDGDLRIDYDRLAQTFGSAKSHEAEGIVREATFKARESAIEVAMKNPEAESWIIHTFMTDEQSKRYEEAGADIVVLDPSKEVCLERAEKDERPQTTVDGINRWYAEKKGNTMEHRFKSFEMKAQDNGMIAGYFSTYDVEPDSYGDIIEKGAFTETFKKREESGHPFPLCFNHDFSAVIGSVKKVEDTEKGPYIEAEFLDTQMAQDVRKMLQSGAIYQFSFAYDVLQSRVPTEDEKKMGIGNVLQKLEVFEISVVTVPANQNAVATEVKSAEPDEPDAMLITKDGTVEFVKQGKRNSQKDEDIIRQAVAQMNNCIKSLESLLESGEEDKPTEDEAKEEDTPKTNAIAEESESASNSKRAEDLLSKINSIKGDS